MSFFSRKEPKRAPAATDAAPTGAREAAASQPAAADPTQYEPDHSPWSAGLRFEAAGDVRAALAAYEDAYDTGVRPTSYRAVLRRAEITERRGVGDCEAEFARACGSPESDIQAQAWRGVASCRMIRGDVLGGLAALEAVVATGDADETPRAWRNIGVIREDDLGDLDGARRAFEASIEYDHPRHSDGARVNLAQLRGRQGDRPGALQLMRRATRSGNPAEAARATVLLGQMMQEQGDLEEAMALWTGAVSGSGEWADRAACNLAGVLFERGDPAAALPYFRRGTQLPDPVEAAIPSFMAGLCELRLGNAPGARGLLEFASAHGSPQVRAEADRLLRQPGM